MTSIYRMVYKEHMEQLEHMAHLAVACMHPKNLAAVAISDVCTGTRQPPGERERESDDDGDDGSNSSGRSEIHMG